MRATISLAQSDPAAIRTSRRTGQNTPPFLQKRPCGIPCGNAHPTKASMAQLLPSSFRRLPLTEHSGTASSRLVRKTVTPFF